MKIKIKTERLIIFEKITGENQQIKILYKLLENRMYNISNKSMPSLFEHKKFVINHPYRVWFLLRIRNNYIGSVYIMKNNCIGVNLTRFGRKYFLNVLDYIITKYRPLKEIKSVRASEFHINIAPNNKHMLSQLNKVGARPIQVTYSLAIHKIR